MPITRKKKAANALSSAAAGAATGAGVAGPYGAAAGGLIGLLSGLLGSDKTHQQVAKEQASLVKGNKLPVTGTQPSNNPEGIGTYSVYSPQQQAALNTILGQALSGLGQNKFDFAPIEQQARTNFAQQTIPSIAERFTAMGSGPGSSGFNRFAAHAGKDLENQLASMKSGYNLQQQALLQNLLRLGLTPQYEAYFKPGDNGGFGNSLLASLVASGGIENVGKLLGNLRRNSNDGSFQSEEPFSFKFGGGSGGPDIGGPGDFFGGSSFNQGSKNPSPGILKSSLQALQNLYNPSNIVAGTSNPQGIGLPSGIQEKAPSEKMSNVEAMKKWFGF